MVPFGQRREGSGGALIRLSDWRDGFEHEDAVTFPAIYDRGYLQANVEGGEGFDWYYASAADRESQMRTGITDGAHGKPSPRWCATSASTARSRSSACDPRGSSSTPAAASASTTTDVTWSCASPRVADGEARTVEAIFDDCGVFDVPQAPERPTHIVGAPVVVDKGAVLMNLPRLREDMPEHVPLLAAHARPWSDDVVFGGLQRRMP